MTIKYRTMDSLFEVVASKIAHYLFPENFAEYNFIINPNMSPNDEVDAGYTTYADQSSNCVTEHLEGVENVFATAFFLGLEVRSYECIKLGEKTNLFIDDFSHPFHNIDIDEKTLVDEYRDHKIALSASGTLFPTSFLDEKCGYWIDQECDIGKLENAYKKIVQTPISALKDIIDAIIYELQSIECGDESCKSESLYQVCEAFKGAFSYNHAAIKTLLGDIPDHD